MEKLIIADQEYSILDTKEKMTVADSFVKRSNKIMTGNGEAKFYVGNDNEETRLFFGQYGFVNRCFILRKDLIQYLADSEAEYRNPQQPYRNKNLMPEFWTKRKALANELPDILWFTITEQTQIAGSRIYIKSDDLAYDWIRELSLPFITYLSAIKLKDKENNILFYFRLFIDYFGETEHPAELKAEEEKVASKAIPDEEKIKFNMLVLDKEDIEKHYLTSAHFVQ